MIQVWRAGELCRIYRRLQLVFDPFNAKVVGELQASLCACAEGTLRTGVPR